MHTFFALLCFVVVIHWLIFPYPPGLLRLHCGNLTIAPVPAKQPWWIWINTSCEIIMNDYITTTKQSTIKPGGYLLGYTVVNNIPTGGPTPLCNISFASTMGIYVWFTSPMCVVLDLENDIGDSWKLIFLQIHFSHAYTSKMYALQRMLQKTFHYNLTSVHVVLPKPMLTEICVVTWRH